VSLGSKKRSYQVRSLGETLAETSSSSHSCKASLQMPSNSSASFRPTRILTWAPNPNFVGSGVTGMSSTPETRSMIENLIPASLSLDITFSDVVTSRVPTGISSGALDDGMKCPACLRPAQRFPEGGLRRLRCCINARRAGQRPCGHRRYPDALPRASSRPGRSFRGHARHRHGRRVS